MRTIDQLLQPHLRDLDPYTPGFQPTGEGWIKLNTNEFPYPPPDAVKEAIAEAVDGLTLYPNPTSQALREALARFHGVDCSQVIVGNGSDDILNLLVRCFGGSGKLTTQTFPSYSLYPVLTAIAAGVMESVEFAEDFRLPARQLVQVKADLLFLTNPNAPTGIAFKTDEIRELAKQFDGILVVDEAYAEFAMENAIPLLDEFEHIVVTRTFSKAYGLAGLRVGYGLGSPAVIDALDRVRDSYNVNRLSQAGALAAIQSEAAYQPLIEEIKVTRERFIWQLRDLGWFVYPSAANFVFVRPTDSTGASGAEVASRLFEHLLGRKILVRYFPKHPLTAAFLRISIGTPSQMEKILEEIRTWQKG